MHWDWQAVTWAVVALVLIAAETLIPGAFMLWLGVAAAAVFVLLLLFDLSLLSQAVAFVVLSVISIQIYRTRFRGRGRQSDRPSLNRRADALVGHVATLHTDIVQGRGRVQIADAYWDVTGPELPAGTRVRVVGSEGMTLRVQSAE
ncbi:NfeD family protein [Lysobacter ciconiae]|uniref:NfeD family protein n=1 Tax=Novilysobacter ciconiae TaxID=2781022 RepID=A0A7S6UFP2_9GAMM|nr:NfeD family protein [Lysobacter ciconiae]QOW19374.1 NfeD family protein [Lysobacter ciconiae]